MGNFVVALIVAIIIALGAYVVLDRYQTPVRPGVHDDGRAYLTTRLQQNISNIK